MSTVLETAQAFPRDAYLRLLNAAQHIFDSPKRRHELFTSLGLISDAAAQRQTPASDAGGSPAVVFLQASSVRLSSMLVDALSEPRQLEVALKLARRLANEIGTNDETRALLATLEELYVRDRLQPPEPAVATLDTAPREWMGFACVHYYALSDRFFGREAQLAELEAWITENAAGASVFSLNALGGSGKSALAWHWLNRALPTIRQAGYRGAFWCSFYEKDFDFADFLRRALTFSSGMTKEAVSLMSRGEVEDKLLELMRREPFVFVIDGLERLMNGYAIVFDRAVDPDAIQGGKQEAEVTSYDRRLTDPRSGAFLRRLADQMASRILITTRLGPADLEDPRAGTLLPHVNFMELRGLAPKDAAELWRSIVPTSPVTDELRAIFTLSGHHPLVISILARSVGEAGGDWETWRSMESHRDFALTSGRTDAEIRAHIIGTCVRDLHDLSYDVLGALTTSGKPMPFDLLSRVLLQGSAANGDERWSSEAQVQGELERLVTLGFVGAAKVGDQYEYDMHPVVRGAAWRLITDPRRDTDPRRERFLSHALSEFFATPDRQDEGADLNKATSLFQLLVQSKELDRAWEMFINKLWPTLARRNDNRTLLSLFELLLPERDALQLLPLASRREQGIAAETLAFLLMTAGDGDRSDRLFRWCGAIRLQIGDFLGFLSARHSRSWQTMYEGRLFQTELDLRAMREDALHFGALDIVPAIECWIGIVLALRGCEQEARQQFERAKGRTDSYRWWAQGLAEGYVYLSDPAQALPLLDLAEKAEEHPNDGPMQQAWEKLTRGTALFQQGEHDKALDSLSSALEASLRANYSIIQCFALPCIAEIFLQDGKIDDAEAQVQAYFRLDPESRYQLSASDAWRVLALCQLARGDRALASEYAAQAYRLSACDGPPFVYREGLKRAFDALEKCGAYVPRTEARLHPDWRRLLAQFTPNDVPSVPVSDADAARLESEEAAREFLRVDALMREASENDRRWWSEITSEAPTGLALPLAHAMTEFGISLENFRSAYEKSGYNSVLVVFHQLHAASIAGSHQPQPIADLEEEQRAVWLSNVEEHERTLTAFLATNHARQVAFAFAVHHLDTLGIKAFLQDDKRRIEYEKAGLARQWWDQLERVCPPMDMLILAEGIFLAGATLEEFVCAISAGMPRGIEYAFSVLRLQRAIAAPAFDFVSNTDGWTDVQIFLRLEDVKQRLGWRSAGSTVREYWTAFEKRSGQRLADVLRVAEELAIRRTSIADYHRAYLFTNIDKPEANLAYVDYDRYKQQPWDGEPPRWWLPDDPSAAPYTDTSGWSEKRIRRRLGVVRQRVGFDAAAADAQAWWTGLEHQFPPSVMLRVAEELDARHTTVSALHLAHIDGATDNVRAAFAYLNFTRIQQYERRQASQRATLRNSEANTHYENGRYRDAIASYEAAIAEEPDEPVFYTNLAGAWERVADLTQTDALQNAIDVLERGLQHSSRTEKVRAALDVIRNKKLLLDRGAFLSSPEMVAVVTPIAVEVASDLTPLIEAPEDSLLTATGILRDRIAASTGIRIPDTRFRGNASDLPPGTYLIMLDEIPIVMDTVPADGGATEQAQYLMRHLDRVIHRNLADFITHQLVVDRLVVDWPARAEELTADPELLSRFARALRAFVEEGVPTVAFPVLCAAFLEHTRAGANLDQTLRMLRLLPEIRPQLPGNPNAVLLGLSQRIEAEIIAGLHPYGDESVLLLEPVPTQKILSAVRSEVGGNPDEIVTALVVQDGVARRYVRKLAELEFPDLMVLAQEEVDPVDRAITRVVELE